MLRSGTRLSKLSLKVETALNTMKKNTFKFLALLLLLLFTGDALAIWDIMERFGFGFHSLALDSQTSVQIHQHDSEETEHKSLPIDTCTLCPCCVFVNMCISSSAFRNNILIQSMLYFATSQVSTSSEHHIFHPPRSVS